jgi:putative endonuclease
MKLAAARLYLLEQLIRTLDRLPARRRMTTPNHLRTGQEGELSAYFHLRRLGYTIVARDWKCPKAPGDIDLIAWDSDTLCFVEVKTRTTRDFATAESSVDNHKRRTLRRLASHYLRHLPDHTPHRFDVLSIYLTPPGAPNRIQAPTFELFRNAFSTANN